MKYFYFIAVIKHGGRKQGDTESIVLKISSDENIMHKLEFLENSGKDKVLQLNIADTRKEAIERAKSLNKSYLEKGIYIYDKMYNPLILD